MLSAYRSSISESFEPINRTSHPANQLSICGAVARWCEDFGTRSDEKPPKTVNDGTLKEIQPKEVTSFGKSTKECSARSWKQVCVKFNRTSKHWEEKSNLQEFVKKRHSSTELLSENSTRTVLDVDEASALKCMVSLLFFLLNIPRIRYWMSRLLDLFHHQVGCVLPFSFKRVI